MKEEEAQKVVALVVRLADLTRAGKIHWEYPPTGVARTTYRGTEFLVDLPREKTDRLRLGPGIWPLTKGTM